MSGLSLTTLFQSIDDKFLKTSFYFDLFLHNPNFLDVPPQNTNSPITWKLAQIATMAKRAFQRSAGRMLTQKITSGDLAPKPAAKTLLALVEEASLLSRAPALLRVISSPAALSVAAAACLTILILDDTTRNMAMEQLSQIMTLFQSENSKMESGDTVLPQNTPSISPQNNHK